MSIDYSEKMPDLVFTYDDLHVPGKLPDPQIDPIIPGNRVPLKKVGIAPVDLPVKLLGGMVVHKNCKQKQVCIVH